MTTAEERLARLQEYDRQRARRYYATHKQEILAKRKAKRANLDFIEQDPIAPPEPRWMPNEVIDFLNGWAFTSKQSRAVYVGGFKRLVKLTGELIPNEGLSRALKDRSDEIVDAIRKNRKINTDKATSQTIVWLIDRLGGFSADEKKPYLDLYHEMRVESDRLTAERKETNEYMNFDDYVKAIGERAGVGSEFYVLVSLYRWLSVRDDFGSLVIVNEPIETDHLLVPARGPLQVFVKNHKTSARYGPIQEKLPPQLSALIRGYITQAGLLVGDKLFNRKALGSWVSKQNAKHGFPGFTINTFRHMAVSTLESAGAPLKERTELARRMRHTLATSEGYIRPVAQAEAAPPLPPSTPQIETRGRKRKREGV